MVAKAQKSKAIKTCEYRHCPLPVDPTNDSGLCRFHMEYDGSGFLPEAMHQRKRLDIYCNLLNQDAQFVGELQVLGRKYAILYRKYGRRVDSVGHQGQVLVPEYEELKDQVVTFVEQWGLPRELGPLNVMSSLRSYRRDPDSVRLHNKFGTTFGFPPEWKTYFDPSDYCRIRPMPKPFTYFPLHSSSSWVREVAKHVAAEVEVSIIKQAEEIEQKVRDVGWRKASPRYHRAPPEFRVAKRLYRRVLKWTWVEITKKEIEETGYNGSFQSLYQSVRSTVPDWAESLDIPLPKLPPGPRKKTC